MLRDQAEAIERKGLREKLKSAALIPLKRELKRTTRVFHVADGQELQPAHKQAILEALTEVKVKRAVEGGTVAIYGGLSSNVQNRWECYIQHQCIYDTMYELLTFVGPGAAAIIAAAETYLIEILQGGQVWDTTEVLVCNREDTGGGGQCGSPVQSLYVAAR